MLDLDKPRPPYVQFEVRAVEDRTASVESGHYVAKDVIFAIVTPSGTKDRLEKPAEEWLEGVYEGVRQERIPADWYEAYKRSYHNFRESREDPENGTAVKDWPALSPAQVRLLLDLNIRTVEDAAAMTEEAMQRIGMGGRALREKARAYLDTAAGPGKVAAEVEALRTENEALKARNAEVMERLARLEAAQQDANNGSVSEDESITEEAED